MAELPPEVARLVEQREALRASGDFAAADALRERIRGAGYEVRDEPSGPPVVTPSATPPSISTASRSIFMRPLRPYPTWRRANCALIASAGRGSRSSGPGTPSAPTASAAGTSAPRTRWVPRNRPSVSARQRPKPRAAATATTSTQVP